MANNDNILVRFAFGDREKVDSAALVEGKLYLSTDTQELFYVPKDSTTKRKIGDIIEVDNLTEVTTPISGKFYYEENTLYRYIDNEWKPIGSDVFVSLEKYNEDMEDIQNELDNCARIVDDPDVEYETVGDIIEENLSIEADKDNISLKWGETVIATTPQQYCLTYDDNFIYLRWGETVISRVPRDGGSVVKCTNIVFDSASAEIRTANMSSQYNVMNYTLSPENCTESVTFDSSDKDVATINPNTGVITVIANGQTSIMATCGEYSDTYVLNVVDLNIVDSITFTPDSDTVTLSEFPSTYSDLPMPAVMPADCVYDTIIYTSSDNTIATVDATTGVLTLLKDGVVAINAECKDKTAVFTLTIVDSSIIECEAVMFDVEWTAVDNSESLVYTPTITLTPTNTTETPVYTYESLVMNNATDKIPSYIPTINQEDGKLTATNNNGFIGKYTVTCGEATDEMLVACTNLQYGLNSISCGAKNGVITDEAIGVSTNNGRWLAQSDTGFMFNALEGDEYICKMVDVHEGVQKLKVGVTPLLTDFPYPLFASKMGNMFYRGCSYGDPGWNANGTIHMKIENGYGLLYPYGTAASGGKITVTTVDGVKQGTWPVDAANTNGFSFVFTNTAGSLSTSNPIIWNGVTYTTDNNAMARTLISEMIEIEKNGVHVYGAELIDFTVDGVSYRCKKDLTWATFVAHLGYNKNSFTIDDDKVITVQATEGTEAMMLDGVQPTDVITNGTAYTSIPVSQADYIHLNVNSATDATIDGTTLVTSNITDEDKITWLNTTINE